MSIGLLFDNPSKQYICLYQMSWSREVTALAPQWNMEAEEFFSRVSVSILTRCATAESTDRVSLKICA